MALSFLLKPLLSGCRLVLPLRHPLLLRCDRLELLSSFVRAGDAVVEIPRSKVTAVFSRSSGAGGQNVNKVSTKAELRFSVEDADWMDDHTKARLRVRYATFLTKEGDIVITSQRHRTQAANLEDAFEKLHAMVVEAASIPKVRHQRTGLSELTKQTYREDKVHRASLKARRKSMPAWED